MRTPEPFQREKDIRSGKLDSEIPGYEEITGWIGRVPMTWLPGILMNVVKQCVGKNVFRDKNALLRTVGRFTEQNDFLRADAREGMVIKDELQAVEKDRDRLRSLLLEAKEVMHEIVAYGNCDCNIPTGETCVPCQCALINQRIQEALQPKEAK